MRSTPSLQPALPLLQLHNKLIRVLHRLGEIVERRRLLHADLDLRAGQVIQQVGHVAER